RAQAAGELTADVELDVGVAHQQCLCVGVDRDELDPLEADLDHAIDRVHPAAADADDLDDREVVVRRCHAALPNWTLILRLSLIVMSSSPCQDEVMCALPGQQAPAWGRRVHRAESHQNPPT